MARRHGLGAHVTTLQGGKAAAEGTELGTRDGRVRQMVARLRESAARLVPFSEARRLFLDAASMLERLDAEGEGHAAAVRRLEAELANQRSVEPLRARGD